MKSSLEQIANRIIVCGIDEILPLSNNENIGGIVSLCQSKEYKNENNNPIAIAKAQGISHHQSLPFEQQDLSFSKHNSEGLSEEEWHAFHCEQIGKTLDQIDAYLNTTENKKVIMHCGAGSDRSAIMAVAYLLRYQDNEADIDQVLKILHKIRPQAKLQIRPDIFQSSWGLKFDVYANAINEYCSISSIYHEFNGNTQGLAISVKDIQEQGLSTPSLEEYTQRLNRFDMKL